MNLLKTPVRADDRELEPLLGNTVLVQRCKHCPTKDLRAHSLSSKMFHPRVTTPVDEDARHWESQWTAAVKTHVTSRLPSDHLGTPLSRCSSSEVSWAVLRDTARAGRAECFPGRGSQGKSEPLGYLPTLGYKCERNPASENINCFPALL